MLCYHCACTIFSPCLFQKDLQYKNYHPNPPFPFPPPLWDRLTQCVRCSMHIRFVHVYVSWFSDADTRPRNQKSRLATQECSRRFPESLLACGTTRVQSGAGTEEKKNCRKGKRKRRLGGVLREGQKVRTKARHRQFREVCRKACAHQQNEGVAACWWYPMHMQGLHTKHMTFASAASRASRDRDITGN